jgi:hypothetical protein
MLIFLSCSKEQQCSEQETSSLGNVRSISGPDTLTAGKTVALIVEVATNDSFCTKRADAYIIETSDNYVQIGASLVHVPAGHQNCTCMNTPTIKTLIYFTPNKKGNYIFGTKKPDSTINSLAPDTSDYKVFVP